MVDVKKVTASFNALKLIGFVNVPNPLPTPADQYLYVNVDPEFTVKTDPFDIIVNRDVPTFPGIKTVTGFLIPFSRKYSISVIVQPQVAYASSSVNLGTDYKTFLCGITKAELLTTSITAIIPGSVSQSDVKSLDGAVFGHGSGTISINNILSDSVISANLTAEIDLFAGDFVYFRQVLIPKYPPNGNLYFSGSPIVYAKIEEITDL